jgi:ribose-phosphate pyrophosphokinase
MIVPGLGSETLARRLAERLKHPLAHTETKAFPDGERYARVREHVDGDAVVVQTLWPPERLMDALLLCDAARRAGAERVTLVTPYLAYARQDQVFQEGEALSAAAMAKAVSTACDALVTVDPHKEKVLEFFQIDAQAVSATQPVAEALKQRKVQCILAPDEGALDRARGVADACGAESDHLEKTRIDSQTVEVRPKNLDVKDRRVAIVDDIISTGGTMATALGLLKNQGAAATYAVGVHGLFISNAEDRLKKAGVDEILTTDTVYGPFSQITVAGVLADALVQTKHA